MMRPSGDLVSTCIGWVEMRAAFRGGGVPNRFPLAFVASSVPGPFARRVLLYVNLRLSTWPKSRLRDALRDVLCSVRRSGSPPCGEEGVGREIVVREIASLVQFGS